MKKEEILEKSRKENKNQDVYEKEVIIKGNRYACIAAVIVATILFVVQILVGGGMNYGIYAVVCSIPMASRWTRYAKLRKKEDLFSAVCFTIAVLSFSAVHIYRLIATAGVL